MVPLIYLSNSWRTLEMPLINCEINLDLSWPKNCAIMDSNADQGTTFSITDIKLYVLIVTLSTWRIRIINKKTKLIFRLLNWSKFSRGKWTFCFIIWRWSTTNKLQTILSSNCRNKKICYDRCKKRFWSAS